MQPWTYLASRLVTVARPMALLGEHECNDPVAVLPPPFMHAVFSCLPADDRARAASVCRGWRAALADPSLWTHLDLSEESGVVCRVDDAALRAAAARARGGLQSLTLSFWEDLYAALRAVAAENAATLQELCMFSVCDSFVCDGFNS